MKKEIRRLLRKFGLFPISRNNWNIFTLNHKKPVAKWETRKVTRNINDNVKDFGGIYIYENKLNEILYVGEGKYIGRRLRSHYRESYKRVKKYTKAKRWYRFFASNRGKLTVYWKKVGDEIKRKTIEQMLTYILNPKFLEAE